MANEKHYPAGTPGNKGGQFAPKGGALGGEITKNSNSSLSYVPETTSRGEKRTFYADLSPEDQEFFEKSYLEKYKEAFEAIDELKNLKDTSKDSSDQRQFLRKKLINDEFESQLNDGMKVRGRKAVLVLGLPGSGKSSIAEPLSKEEGAFIVDADSFKKRIPEFAADPRMVSAVHKESVDLSNEFRNELADKGYNMLIGKVGGDYESVGYILDDLAKKGYECEVILNDLPIEEAINRAMERFDSGKTDRLIPFWTLKIADKNIFNTFDKVLEHPVIKKGTMYSNDVKKGEKPILIHEFNK